MRRKESIIRYLAKVGRANRYQIVTSTGMPLTVVSPRLTELKYKGLVQKMKWSDNERVWMLTPRGYKRHEYYQQRDEKRKELGEEAGPSR